jgi:hypothetical protein
MSADHPKSQPIADHDGKMFRQRESQQRKIPPHGTSAAVALTRALC